MADIIGIFLVVWWWCLVILAAIAMVLLDSNNPFLQPKIPVNQKPMTSRGCCTGDIRDPEKRIRALEDRISIKREEIALFTESIYLMEYEIEKCKEEINARS